MKILIVSYYDIKSGGTGVSTHFMAKSLKKLGHEVYIASKSVFPGVETFVFNDIRLLPHFSLRDSYLSNFIDKIIKKKNMDIVHVSDYRFSFMGCQKAADKNHIPCVLHLRDYWFECLKGDLLFRNKELCCGMERDKCLKCLPAYRKLWERYKFDYFQKKLNLVKSTDAVVAVSEFVAKEMKKFLGEKKIDVINDFFEKAEKTTHFTNTQLVNKHGSKIKVLFAGRLVYHKGIMTLLEVAKEISKINKEIVFLVAGEGESKKECENYIKKNNLNNVELLGYVNQEKMGSLYDFSDIVYFPSILPEPLGRTVIEAMSHGISVIASGVGGIKEIITDNENGILAKTGCVSEHVEKILDLSSNKEKRCRIGLQARQRSYDFLEDQIGLRLERVYKKALSDY
jgi:glycosyltransferase involved in cell wall biosynthesis